MFTRMWSSAALGVAAASLSPAAAAAPVELGEIPVCTQVVPAAISVTKTPVTVHVRVLMDGVSIGRAVEILGWAQNAYKQPNITLEASFQPASFNGTDAAQLIGQAKAFFGGVRPAGVDVVYVMTNKDLTDAVNGSGVAGLADCIGGVIHPDRAFAVGEVAEYPTINLVAYKLYTQTGAKVMAHEIGHLLGAHHHYANCVEGLIPMRDAPCTLMFNTIELQKLDFSILENTVVRGHAQAYAAP